MRWYIVLFLLVLVLGCRERIDDRILELHDRTVDVNDVDDCTKLVDRRQVVDCYAGKLPDVYECRKIFELKNQITCFESITERNFTRCSFLEESREKGYCLRSNALLSKDPVICRLLEGHDSVDLCIFDVAVASRDPKVCSTMNDTLASIWCVMNISYSTLEHKDCRLINDSSARALCITEVALLLEDDKVCAEHKEVFNRDSCYQRLASAEDDEKLCGRITNERARNTCYTGFAESKDSPILCGFITNKDEHYRCMARVAAKSGNMSLCTIENIYWNDFCYKEIAIATGNADICGSLKDLNTKIDCYINLSISDGDYGACLRMKAKAGNQNECLAAVAKLTKNASICSLIVYEYDMNSCKKGI